jgi:glycosyltransferase involved in cell wall biosynthesis
MGAITYFERCSLIDREDLSMHILSVAYPLFPVNPDSAGGAEQILSLLERGLTARGHRSTVVAAQGSHIQGELIETPAAHGPITDAIRAGAQSAHAAAIAQALAQSPFDLIHFHGLDFHAYLPNTPAPKLATMHLPLAWYPESVFELPGIVLCCVSQSQARTARDGLPLPVVPNGIALALYPAAAVRGDYLLWLGRVCPEKGAAIALRVARKLDLPLIAAGPVHPFASHQEYFDGQVAPLLDEKRSWIGPVGRERKTQLLAAARCVLIPSLAAETGSLVAMEAIASGTPVIAFRAGALPEIVESGVTGFIVDSEDEMAHAVHRIHEISSARCREEARRRFDADRMVEDYLNLYRDLLAAR